LSAQCPTTSLNDEPPSTQSPFAQCGPYLHSSTGETCTSPRRALPLLLRSYGLMRRSRHLSSTSAWTSVEGSLQVAIIPCCSRDLPDDISENLSCDAWAFTTTVCRVLCLFLPLQHRPSTRVGSAYRELPAKATSRRSEISQQQPFLYVQASQFARHSGRSPPSLFPVRAVCGFYLRAEHALLPSHASDLLAV
jgi:hypothetical protein